MKERGHKQDHRILALEHDDFCMNRHCERSEAIHLALRGLLRCARNDGLDQSDVVML